MRKRFPAQILTTIPTRDSSIGCDPLHPQIRPILSRKEIERPTLTNDHQREKYLFLMVIGKNPFTVGFFYEAP